ncbi:hypothetical protein ACWPKS_13310 [Coraliomargarita sp. W4R72]
MKIQNLILFLVVFLPLIGLGVEPVEYNEVIKAFRQGESLTIDTFLGEEENFEKGKQYKITGDYKMLPFVVTGIEAPSTRYRIAVWGVKTVGGHSRNIENLGDYISKEIEGSFDLRFRYEDCDLLILTMSPINSSAAGGILLSDSTSKRKIERVAKEDTQQIISTLIR